MTVITNERQIEIKALRKAGIKPMAISKQLGIKYGTIKGYLHRLKLNETLPPKVRVSKNYFTGRIPGIIRRYLEDYPNATDTEVLHGCELKCGRQYLNKYLNKNGLRRKDKVV
ncbi:hypothetical protein BC833DRAFT_578391 [Globomyces pollinis-pini]|nr:hypothetical protein BC833DRAFT_578391 [Globomyces pollinis-pini]